MTNYPLGIYRGDTHRWQFTLWADAAKTQPADLTGVAVAAWIAQQSAAVTHLACTVAANVITVALEEDISQGLSLTAGRWDLQLTYPSGDVQTVVAGSTSVRADVTGASAA
jgi:hypothetical protein